MKRKLLLFSASVFTLLTANAQITITQADMPAIGKVSTEAIDTAFLGITPGNAGSTSWNFSNMVNHQLNQTGYVNPATLSAFSTFPTANLGTTDATGTQGFANSSATSVDFLGAYGDFGMVSLIAIVFNPYQRLLNFPSTYGSTFSQTFTYNVKDAYTSYPGIDSIKLNASVASTSLIDGFGPVTTPQFSNVPSLRQKTTNVTTSESFIKGALSGGAWMSTGPPATETKYSYTWYSNTQQASIAQIETDSAGLTTSAKYLISMQTGAVAISESNVEKTGINVYPNPAKNSITISGVSEVSFFVVSDVTGKLIGNSLMKNFTNTYDVSTFENGIYFYQAMDLKGNVISKGKFVVAK